MANNGNLVPFNVMPADRHREISAAGGIASGEARRYKRSVKNAAILEERIQNEFARDSFRIMHEASSMLADVAKCLNTEWALEYSPSLRSFRIIRTATAARENFLAITNGKGTDYILMAVSATKEQLQKMISEP